MLSVVIPTLNAAEGLAATLATLPAGAEVIVADGGSEDASRAIAEALGARVVAASPGRGVQLRAGAAAARGAWLLFLHADTRLDDAARAAIAAHIAAPESRAGYLRFALDDDSAPARRLARLVALRCRLFALPYGDQGLLIPRALYDALGGHPAIPLMEDVALVRRLGRRRLVMLEGSATTSAARYRRDGYLRRSARNLALLALYFCGVSPAKLAKLY